MTLSLNEVETLAKKATRGAGYSWGMAEEAGKATRWLCARNLDGALSLRALLEAIDIRRNSTANWQSIQGAESGICPLFCGTAFSDDVSQIMTGPVRYEDVIEPKLLVPFASDAAIRMGVNVSVVTQTDIYVTDGVELSVRAKTRHDPQKITVSLGGQLTNVLEKQTRAFPTVDTIEKLNYFAHRTYAPATEESRRKGAGTGLSDND